MTTASEMNGPAKAAVFLLSLDAVRATKIIERLDDESLRLLRKAMESIGTVSLETIESVYADFSRDFRGGVTSLRGGGSYLEDLVAQVRGADEAAKVFADPNADPKEEDVDEEAPPLASLAEADPDVLTFGLQAEHPQVAAAVVAHLDPALACHVVSNLPIEQRAEIIGRIATLDRIPEAAFLDAEAGLGGVELAAMDAGDVDGNSAAVAILTAMAEDAATELIDKLAEEQPEEADALRKQMFTFDLLVDADKRGMQNMLREIETDTLLVALKTASEHLKGMFFAAMSSRAAAMLVDELASMAPVRLNEVEQAQQQIVEVALRLMGEGKLTIAGRGEQMV